VNGSIKSRAIEGKESLVQNEVGFVVDIDEIENGMYQFVREGGEAVRRRDKGRLRRGQESSASESHWMKVRPADLP